MTRLHLLFLAACLAAGVALRCAGLERGTSDFAVDGAATAFHHFHPDEEMVVDAARGPLDPLDPPFTVYGLLPLYALRAGLALVPASPSPADVYVTARALAALCSSLVLWLTWTLGRRHFGAAAGCAATFFVAFSPGAIQQAHFYIVDGLFGLLSLAAIAAILRARDASGRRAALVAGALIGATAAVKLTGLMLGAVLFVALCHARLDRAEGRWLRAARSTLAAPGLWLAAAAAAATLVLLEPYLVADPGRVFRADWIGDFAASAATAEGEVLRPWTLADAHTIPYLRHWTDLLPLISGAPLTALFLAGLVHALWRRTGADVAILTWVVLYFGLVGGLHAKHVRYLVPLVPLLALPAARLWCLVFAARGAWGRLGRVAAAAVGVYTAAYGLAFARLYLAEDARIQAARWIREQVPAGSRIAVERGGYSMGRMISGQRYALEPIHEMRFFAARGYLTCGGTQDVLHDRLAQADWVAIVDANRYLQYTAVPELMPAMAAFYEGLVDGRMGFEVARRFEVPVALAGIDFSPRHPEVSFVGYDHPAVYVLRRRDDFEAAWAAWRVALRDDPHCPDGALAGVVAAVGAGELTTAVARARAAEAAYPETPLAALVAAWAHARAGQVDEAAAATRRYLAGARDPSRTAWLAPWATAMSLAGLGLPEPIPQVLAEGRRRAAPGDVKDQAQTYTELGLFLAGRGDAHLAAEAYAQALALDAGNAPARVNLAWHRYLEGHLAEAIALNRQVLAAGPHDVALFNLALASLAAGAVDTAEACYARGVAAFGADGARRIGADADLRELARRGVQVEVAERILDRYWPQAEPAN